MAVPIGAIVGGGGLAAATGLDLLGGALENRATREARLRNREILEQLLAEQEAGAPALSPAQQRLLDASLNAPVASAATEAQRRAEQLQAATGGASGADLARLRTERTRALGAGAQQAALQVQAAKQAAEEQRAAEIEQRLALDTDARIRTQRAILDPLVSGFTALGPAGGAAPGTFGASGLFGGASAQAREQAAAGTGSLGPADPALVRAQLFEQGLSEHEVEIVMRELERRGLVRASPAGEVGATETEAGSTTAGEVGAAETEAGSTTQGGVRPGSLERTKIRAGS